MDCARAQRSQEMLRAKCLRSPKPAPDAPVAASSSKWVREEAQDAVQARVQATGERALELRARAQAVVLNALAAKAHAAHAPKEGAAPRASRARRDQQRLKAAATRAYPAARAAYRHR